MPAHRKQLILAIELQMILAIEQQLILAIEQQLIAGPGYLTETADPGH
jgi:hypothetical protein